MKKAKIKKQVEKENQQPEAIMSGKSAIVLLCSMVIVFVSFYFLTDFLVAGRREKATPVDTNTNTNTNTNDISFNQLLKQKEDSYYVFALIDDKIDLYEGYVSEIGETYYEIDMKNAFNKSYIGEETKVGTSTKDIRIADSTLFVIEKGKIKNHYTGKEAIVKYLQESLPDKSK